MKGIILHGGHGTRLRPLTHTGPKQLLPIANKPMSQYCIESLKNAGITDIAIIIGGTGSSKVQEYYGVGEKFGVKFTYIHQDSPRGIAHAISLCQQFIGKEKFTVFLGDNILEKSILQYKIEFEKSNASASILLCKVDNPTRFGIADVKDGIITKIMEKPKNPPTNLAVTGIYFLTPIIFDIISRLKPSTRNELEITDALQMLMEEGNEITYNTVTDYWKDTGTSDDIINANKFILEHSDPYFYGEKEEGVILSNNIMVGKNSIIKNGAKIIGPAIIGKNCIIHPYTTIGPNASIGDNSVIGKCNIEDSIIMANCNIDGEFKIKDSIIAFNCILTSKKNECQSFLLGEGTKISL
jgi:glucose-1-phosphate thymidylyltransferase